MTSLRVFRGFDISTGTWTDTAALVFAALFVLLVLVVLAVGRGKPADRYHNGLAWLRACAYFCFCWGLAAATGVMEKVFDLAGLGGDKWGDAAWLGMTALFLVVVVHGYFIAWPRGTYHEDRRIYWTSPVFGLVWGLSEAQLHLCFWALLEMTGLATPWIALMQFGVMSATFPWHVLYWDRYVSPAHNILEWNGQKVAKAHMPNTFTAILYMALFGDPTYYVAIEALSLVAASVVQRFPPPWRSEWHGRPILREGGVKAAALGLDAKTLLPLVPLAPTRPEGAAPVDGVPSAD